MNGLRENYKNLAGDGFVRVRGQLEMTDKVTTPVAEAEIAYKEVFANIVKEAVRHSFTQIIGISDISQKLNSEVNRFKKVYKSFLILFPPKSRPAFDNSLPVHRRLLRFAAHGYYP